MATLQIKHFLLIRNEFEMMKRHLIKDRNTLAADERPYESVFLVMLMDRIILKYSTLLLADLKWVMLEEMKATASASLRKKLLKAEKPELLGLDQHGAFIGFVSDYLNEKNGVMKGNFLEVQFIFERLYETAMRSQHAVHHQRVPPVYVLDYYPQWKPMWDLFVPRGR